MLVAQQCEWRWKLSLPWPVRLLQLLWEGKDNECFHILPWKFTRRPLYQLRACFSLEWPLSNLTFQLFFSFSSWFCHPSVPGWPSEPQRMDKEFVMLLQTEIERPDTQAWVSATTSLSCLVYFLTKKKQDTSDIFRYPFAQAVLEYVEFKLFFFSWCWYAES